MDIKNFLQSSYNKDNFIEYIFDSFYGFEENYSDYELPNESEKKHIEKYRLIGQTNLSDGKEIGFFEIIVKDNVNIENNRVSLNASLKKYASNNFFDGAIATFYNPSKSVWRLSFLKFSYDHEDNEKTTNLKRYTYILGENIPIKTSLKQLEKIKKGMTLDDIENAFSVEALNDMFFKDYKQLFEDLNNNLQIKSFSKFEENEENIRAFSKKLLGRITFLYFLQKKGWMGASKKWGDGDKNFLQNTFKNILKDENFYEKYLKGIFFEALNEDRSSDDSSYEPLNCKIPFLNGGLFESKDFDEETLLIDNSMFENIFEIFSHYNFTIIEDLPHDSEVAIDPEMLGKVFENLLEENYKSKKGTFYTPREIVHYMCKQSIYEALLDEFSDFKDDLYDLIFKDDSNVSFLDSRKNAVSLEKKIKSLKILDPAIGSGAFPIGLLNEMVGILHNINKMLDDAEAKIEIIENCIYGIDIDASAVEIAKLRFWLSIVVDEEEPKPLPNLDFKIMQGNSLLETINGFNPLKQEKRITRQKQVRQLKNQTADDIIFLMQDKFHEYYDEHDKVKKKNIYESIKRDVILILQKSLEKFDTSASLLDMSKDEEQKLNYDRKTYFLLNKIVKDFKDSESTTELFLYKVYFSEIVGENVDEENYGFNIIIGNPPYLRIQGIDDEISEQYKKVYSSATGRYDLYVLFVEKGLKLLSKNGILNYIMPHKWTNSAFGKGLRGLSKDKLSKIISFGAYQVFNASTYTSLSWFKNNSSKENDYLQYVELDKDLYTNKELEEYLFGLNDKRYTNILKNDLKSDSWLLTDKNTYEVLKKLQKQDYRLEDIFEEVFQGTVTTGDDIFYMKGHFEKDKFIGYSDRLGEKVVLESDIIKPLLMGDNVKRYAPLKNELYTIYPHYLENEKTKPFEEDEFKDRFPLTYEYLLNFKDELVQKKIKYKTNKNYWYSLHRSRDIKLFEQEKILTTETSLGSNMTIDTDNFYTNTQNYSLIKYKKIKESYKFYLSILNSNILWFFIKNTGAILANGYFRFKTSYLNPFPIPKIERIEDTKSFEILVEYVIYLKTLDNKIDKYVENSHVVKTFEDVINALVYELYFPNEFKDNNIEFLKYAKKYFESIKNQNDNEKIKIINSSYQLLREKDNEIRNNLHLMPIRIPLLAPIMESI